MAYQLNRQEIGDAVWFSSVSDPKFKLNRISVSFVVKLQEERASDYAVVPFLLRKGCRECPDFTQLNARLCQLYGASIEGDVRKYGQNQILNVSIQGIDDRFALEGEAMTRECAQLLQAVLLDPHLENGLFPEQDLQLEKQYLLDTIRANINDKRSYAINRCVTEMCKGEPTAVQKYGTLEQAEKITAASATEAYRRLVDTAQVEILFVGSGDPAPACQIFQEAFSLQKRHPEKWAPENLRESADKVQEIREEMELSQSKLVMGFRTPKITSPKQYNALRMMAALYGATPFSRLFVYVREKMSLCYYCAARYDRGTQLLLVDSGVEAEKKETAQKEILRQLEIIQRGEFTEEEFQSTLLSLKNILGSITDSLSGIEGYYTTQILSGSDSNPEKDIAAIEELTREDIIQAAQTVTLDTVYFLAGNQEGEGEAV